jgi:selenocysteine lyase/cysteine desulfurase
VDRRGGTVAFNFVDANGREVDASVVERLAARQAISLRTGCFCNPGAGEVSLGISKGELDACFLAKPDRMSYDEFRRCIAGKGTGAVRVSLGLASTTADIEATRRFAGELVDADVDELERRIEQVSA